MSTPGILPITLLPNWPAPPQGIMVDLQAAVGPCCIAPDGLHVPDTVAAQAYLSSYVGGAAELAFNRSTKLGQLAIIYGSKFVFGFNYTGPDGVKRTFQIDPTSQFNIDVQANASLGSILNGEAWDATSYFIAADNSRMPTSTAADMRTFALAARGYVSSLILHNRTLKDQIAAAPGMATLGLIDITSGWPENP